ncbi:methyltransferase [Arthrobacter sp. D1-29]
MPSRQHHFSGTLAAENTARLRAAGCVFAEEEAQLLLDAFTNPDDLAHAVERRIAGYPVEHILGWAQFCGARIAVDPGVFVPRRRTELLVHLAAELLEGSGLGSRGGAMGVSRQGSRRGSRAGLGLHLSAHDEAVVLVDLCCGSGAVGAALASRVGGLELHAADIDSAAVKCAARNVGLLGGQVHHGDLYEALPPALKGNVTLLAVNAPYVPTDAIATMPPEAREHEPLISLDGGTDGLDVHRRVAAGAREWLGSGGHILIETSRRQALETAGVLAAAGLETRTIHSDELDGTVVIGTAAMGTAASGDGTADTFE